MLSSTAVASRRALQMKGTHITCSVGGLFLVSRHAHVALAQSRTPSTKNPTRRHNPAALFTPIPPRLGYAHVSVSAPPEKAGNDQNGKDKSLDGFLTNAWDLGDKYNLPSINIPSAPSRCLAISFTRP